MFDSKAVSKELRENDPEEIRVCALMKSVGEGDAVAFAELYHLYVRDTYFVCLNILRNEYDAEEAAQVIWTKVWQSAHSFVPATAKVRTWIIAIAKHEAIDRYRYKKRKPVFLVDEEIQTLEQLAGYPGHRLIANRIIADEVLTIAKKVLVRKDFAVLWLRHRYGYEYEEIANMLQLPIGSVKCILFRAYATLRELLDHKKNNQHIAYLLNDDTVIAEATFNETVGINLPPITRGEWLGALDAASDEYEEEE